MVFYPLFNILQYGKTAGFTSPPGHARRQNATSPDPVRFTQVPDKAGFIKHHLALLSIARHLPVPKFRQPAMVCSASDRLLTGLLSAVDALQPPSAGGSPHPSQGRTTRRADRFGLPVSGTALCMRA